MTTKEYLIKTSFDSAGMDRFEQDAKKVSFAARQLGIDMKDASQIIDQSINQSVNRAGETMRTVSTVIESAGRKATVTFRDTANSTQVLGASFQSVGTAAGTFGGELGKIFGRALPTVVIWEALRFALHGVEQILISSVQFMIQWETEMAKVKAVTGATKDELDLLSTSLLNVAEKYALNNKEVGETANQWLRMGANLQTVVPLLEATSKLSLISGASMADSAKSLSAIISSFGLNSNEAGEAVNKLIAVEEKSGVSLEVLTSGFAKAGLTAKAMGLTFDQLAGYIVAVNQESRQSGDLIGTQLRSMFIRLGSTAVQTAQDISRVPFYLDQMGQATTTHTPILRGMNDILTDLAKSWGTLSNAEQDALAKALGGNLRSTAVIALLSNFNNAIKAQKEAATSSEAAGKAIDASLDTVENKVKTLTASWGQLVNTINFSGYLKSVIDGLTQRVHILTGAVNLAKLGFDLLFNPKGLEKKLEEADFNNIQSKNPRLQAEGQPGAKIGEQQKYIQSLLTEDQIKQGIARIEEDAALNRENSLVTVQKELNLLERADGTAGDKMAAQQEALTLKKEKLQVEAEIAHLNEQQASIEEQLKADGASTLQLAIQKLAYLQQIKATTQEIEKQQGAVEVATYAQTKSVQDEILNTLLAQAKTSGETTLAQIQGQIALEDQLGIHLQGVDLLKQQLDLYKAITEESKKTARQREQELADLIKKTPRPENGGFGDSFRRQERDRELTAEARKRGIGQDTIDSILNPNTKANSGGVDSLQDQLKRALADPLGLHMNNLAHAIAELSESITNTRTTPDLSSHGLSYQNPNGTPVTTAQAGNGQVHAANYGEAGYAAGRNVTIDVGGIKLGVQAHNSKELKDEVQKEITELIQAHLLKPGTKLNQAAKSIIDNF